MKPILADTSAFYALADQTDRHHKEAVGIARRLVEEKALPFTTNYVIAETHVLILSRLGAATARTWLKNLSVRVEQVTERDQSAARSIVIDHEDKDYSFTDATSFAVMKRLAADRAFTFDSHFTQFGFKRL
jgi:predicted nucleic acid-binding protein